MNLITPTLTSDLGIIQVITKACRLFNFMSYPKMHNAAFHQGLHCLLKLNNLQGQNLTEIHNLENSTCDPFKYTMGSPMLIVSICMGKSVRIQRVNTFAYL